jgi:hypothetical protein
MVDIAGWAYDAGLRNPVKLAQAVAIAMAESGGNPTHKGDIALQNATWGPSVGLWQIRSLKADKGKGTYRDEDKLSDPAFNAKAMVSISNSGSNWNPWTVTHPTNLLGFARYTAAMAVAPAAVTAMLTGKGAGNATAAVGSALEPVTQLAGTVSDAVQTPVRIAKWLTEPGVWMRIAYLMVGGALVLIGARAIAEKPVDAVVKPIVSGVVASKTGGKAAGASKATTAAEGAA